MYLVGLLYCIYVLLCNRCTINAAVIYDDMVYSLSITVVQSRLYHGNRTVVGIIMELLY